MSREQGFEHPSVRRPQLEAKAAQSRRSVSNEEAAPKAIDPLDQAQGSKLRRWLESPELQPPKK
jgi:hypothetical protein